MKITAKLKNLKNNIVGYFSKEELPSFDDKLKSVLGAISFLKVSVGGTMTTIVEGNSSIRLTNSSPSTMFVCCNQSDPSNRLDTIYIGTSKGKFTIYYILCKNSSSQAGYNKTTISIIKSPPPVYFSKSIEFTVPNTNHLIKVEIDCSNLEKIYAVDLGEFDISYFDAI